LHRSRLRLYGHGFSEEAEAQDDIAETDAVVGKYSDVSLFELLEPGSFHREVVVARLELCEHKRTVDAGDTVA
jgi:hypothetical protein